MSPPPKGKLVISFDDEDQPSPATSPPPAPPPADYPPPQPEDQAFPSVAGVSRPTMQVGGFGPPAQAAGPGTGSALGSVQVRNLVAATVGILVGWVVTEVIRVSSWSATTEAGMNFNAAIFVGILGFCFSVVYVGWEHIEARSTEGIIEAVKRAGPIGAGLGLVSGFLASVIYIEMLQQALETAFSEDGGGEGGLYLARILGWGVFGLGMGVATAATIRSREKLINGAIGGVVGGALGGLIFQWVGSNVSSETFARLISLLVIGAGIGLAIGLVETIRRQAWFSIVGGGMAGKEFVLYEAETRVGSSPKCEITLIKDPGIQPFHFVIAPSPNGRSRTITAQQGSAVTVNGTPISQHTLRNGDRIGVGATTIAYAERPL